MAVEDTGSCQREPFIHVAGAGEREVFSNSHDSQVETLKRSEEVARLANPESVRNETVCVAAHLVVRSSVLCDDASRNGDDPPTLRDNAPTEVAEVEEYMAVVGSSTPVHCDVTPEGFTFRESVSHVLLRHSGRVIDISGLP